ncbi:PQ-loop repeat-containing protein 1 [Rhizoctonia solani]|uniref:PQ-loop repeat-containing protein 1 n=1 Tax=Rhizoctonia solani TaxID=456999 RepID=A0A8H8P953_9AGAM|nr:PQ-loop repeat-containing protein 1 [Rhizoctonia solani]QRW27455.1 PQ-loop repeat-containing protein 1 [Rhizoctonia solani]
MIPSTDTISSALGLASSAAWLGAQFPWGVARLVGVPALLAQLWTNYRLQSADGLALPFLANWLAGDSTNLIGCILTNQLPFQTYLATYFVWIDTCLLVQYIYYEWYRTPQSSSKLEIDTNVDAPQITASPTITVGHLGASTSLYLAAHPDLHDEIGGEPSAMTESFHSERRRGASLAGRGRALDRADEEADAEVIARGIGRGRTGEVETGLAKIGRVLPRSIEITIHPSIYFASSSEIIPLRYVSSPVIITSEDQEQLPPTAPPPVPPPSDDEPDRTSWTWVIGRISAWTCTTLYLTSRMPQIWKNYTRQSVEGLSISLFVFAFLGNFFYVGSVLTSARMFGTPTQRLQYLRDTLPYLLGSAGTFVFDFAIVIQSFIYRGLRPAKFTRGEARRRYPVPELERKKHCCRDTGDRDLWGGADARHPCLVVGRASTVMLRER